MLPLHVALVPRTGETTSAQVDHVAAARTTTSTPTGQPYALVEYSDSWSLTARRSSTTRARPWGRAPRSPGRSSLGTTRVLADARVGRTGATVSAEARGTRLEDELERVLASI